MGQLDQYFAQLGVARLDQSRVGLSRATRSVPRRDAAEPCELFAGVEPLEAANFRPEDVPVLEQIN